MTACFGLEGSGRDRRPGPLENAVSVEAIGADGGVHVRVGKNALAGIRSTGAGCDHEWDQVLFARVSVAAVGSGLPLNQRFVALRRGLFDGFSEPGVEGAGMLGRFRA